LRIATETLRAIRSAIEKDQGNAFRGHLRQAVADLDDAYRTDEQPLRSHLGISGIGKDCSRSIWYSWRWFGVATFSADMLRLFNRGHLEEGRFVAMLRAAGVTVHAVDENGKQFRISDFNGHFGSATDGIVANVPDMNPGDRLIAEYKTHNEKSFKKLANTGVRESKWMHYVQTQLYAGYYRLEHSLYVGVNKNDDTLHAEILPFDPMVATRYRDRAREILTAGAPPPRVNKSPTYYLCRQCDLAKVCHNKEPPLVNCRTCVYASPNLEPGTEPASWNCAHYRMTIPKDFAKIGCASHTAIPNV